ncbi:hypothetical protein HanXRQr2_Chr09g0396771 [Helianthus annuus]|nr:hypothetical protein HanXRQr2_Chr09g0396771 [Helianthus annuus]KAJ0893861.1 hypothetical protein HanPSC8_Chr09g0382541 [Helianthus annuus]
MQVCKSLFSRLLICSPTLVVMRISLNCFFSQLSLTFRFMNRTPFFSITITSSAIMSIVRPKTQPAKLISTRRPASHVHTTVVLLNRPLTFRARLRIRENPVSVFRFGVIFQHPFTDGFTIQRTMSVLHTLPTKTILTITRNIVTTDLEIIIILNSILASRPRTPLNPLITLDISPKQKKIIPFPFVFTRQHANHIRPNRSLARRLRTPQSQTPRSILNSSTHITLPTRLTKPMITPTCCGIPNPDRFETNPTINNSLFI